MDEFDERPIDLSDRDVVGGVSDGEQRVLYRLPQDRNGNLNVIHVKGIGENDLYCVVVQNVDLIYVDDVVTDRDGNVENVAHVDVLELDDDDTCCSLLAGLLEILNVGDLRDRLLVPAGLRSDATRRRAEAGGSESTDAECFEYVTSLLATVAKVFVCHDFLQSGR